MTDELTSLATDEVQAFTDEVRAALLRGKRHSTEGFGTFSSCTRKAKPGRPECTIAMFRASSALREHVSGGVASDVAGPHAAVVRAIVAAMQEEPGVDVPGLGHLGVVNGSGKKPRLIFHAEAALNATLSA